MRRRLLIGVALSVLIGTVALFAQATKILSSGTLPTHCVVGNVYAKTGASAGFYVCLATDVWTGPLGTGTGDGDASTNTSSSVVGEVALFADTSGKLLKRATGSGLAKITSGVLGTASSGTDYVVPAGNVATATALAANGSNCSAGQFPLGVDASGAAESCTALPTTIAGTSNEIAASASTGPVILSLPSTVNLASHTFRVPSSTSLPGTCAVGDAYMDTDATSGQRWFLCESTNTWTAQGADGTGADANGYYLVSRSTNAPTNAVNLGALSPGLLKLSVAGSVATPSTASAGTDYVAPGAATGSGLTQGTGKLLGRTTASSGAIEEITPGNGLGFASGVLKTTCQAGEYDAGNSSTSITLDWNNGNQQIVTLTGNLATLTLSNPAAGCSYRILFVQGSGPYTVTWPSSVKFENDTAPTFTVTNGKVIFCSLVRTTLGADGYLGWCTTNPISQP
jgi:hypothetical protein